MDRDIWSPLDIGDIATAAIALVAVVVSIGTSLWLHRASGPVLRIRVMYYLWLQPKTAPSRFAVRYQHVLGSLSHSTAMYLRFEEDHHVMELLRAHVTNRGRMDVDVDSIAHERSDGQSRVVTQKGDPPYPVTLKAQSWVYLNQSYADLMSFAGPRRRIRFVVNLSSGEKCYSKWIRLYDTPTLAARGRK
jgi:hypothetical protein